MGLMQTESLGGKKYVFVYVDDYSHFTLVKFLRGKSDTIRVCKDLCLQLQCEQGKNVIRIRSDHGREFKNEEFSNFYDMKGILHEYSTPLTSHQNGVVGRKITTLQKLARVILHARQIPLHF